jgi:hypothetical protein
MKGRGNLLSNDETAWKIQHLGKPVDLDNVTVLSGTQ